MAQASDHAARNRAFWDGLAADYAETGRRRWAQSEPSWGRWSVPESELKVLPADLAGSDAIELGCGTAYISAWLARRGANVIGVDNSEAQLATASTLQSEFGLEFPLLHGNAEDVEFPDASFDLVVSEYGASIWCDPYLWIREAARLLRPGGELLFLVNGVIEMLCAPDEEDAPNGDRLLRPYFGMHRFEWSSDDSVEFHIPHGKMVRLLRENGLEVRDLIEVRPPDGSTTRYSSGRLEWAQRWPGEEIWKARKLLDQS